MQIRHESNYTEIRTDEFGASITVYRPQRNGLSVEPGYINASTWGRGNYDEYIAMMGAAIHFLNEFNAILPDWKPVENPIQDAKYLRRDNENYRKAEQERQEKKQAKSVGRK